MLCVVGRGGVSGRDHGLHGESSVRDSTAETLKMLLTDTDTPMTISRQANYCFKLQTV